MTLHLRATRCHLSCGITQCYLPPDTSEHTQWRSHTSVSGVSLHPSPSLDTTP